jgi:hypothetical protein
MGANLAEIWQPNNKNCLNTTLMAELKRTLNYAEVTFFAAGVILGAGIYTIIRHRSVF